MTTRSYVSAGSWLRDARGVTAIEFAVVAPVLLLLIMGILEFSAIMLVSNIMESATAITSRLGKTGFITAGQTREQTIVASITDRTRGLIDPTKLTMSSKAYGEFNQIGDPEPWNDSNNNGVAETGEYQDINGNGQRDTDMGAAGYGGAGAVVVYTASYPWPVMTPLLRPLIGNAQGNYIITSSSVVKNEPYDN